MRFPSIILYAIAVILLLYIIYNIVRTRKFRSSEAIAALGIVVSILAISVNSASPSPIGSSSRVLFEEDFEDGKAQSFEYYGGGEWTVLSDKGNKVFDIDNTRGSGFPGVDFGSTDWKDYAIDYEVKLLEYAGASPAVILEFRKSSDGANKYIQALTPEYQRASLAVTLGANEWQPLTSRDFHIAQGVWYFVRVEAKGPEIKVFINKDLILDTSDTRIDAGGLNLQVGPGTHAQFDDIRVTEFPSK